MLRSLAAGRKAACLDNDVARCCWCQSCQAGHCSHLANETATPRPRLRYTCFNVYFWDKLKQALYAPDVFPVANHSVKAPCEIRDFANTVLNINIRAYSTQPCPCDDFYYVLFQKPRIRSPQNIAECSQFHSVRFPHFARILQ